jgi:hypothetical protein
VFFAVGKGPSVAPRAANCVYIAVAIWRNNNDVPIWYMYLFLSDETNTTQNYAVRFLIFGALLIPMENAVEAVKGILRIRKRASYPQVRNSNSIRVAVRTP